MLKTSQLLRWRALLSSSTGSSRKPYFTHLRGRKYQDLDPRWTIVLCIW
uniref:Uncharacterized protein n=1 Tax=Anguilla anguilla TaxID=7936 RepID=A0A0E9T1E7_ANGAN